MLGFCLLKTNFKKDLEDVKDMDDNIEDDEFEN